MVYEDSVKDGVENVTENGVNSNWKIANWEGVCYDRTDGERL